MCDKYTVILTQHTLSGNLSLDADCRPPTYVDEGSVNHSGWYPPAHKQVIIAVYGIAGHFLTHKDYSSDKKRGLFLGKNKGQRQTNAAVPLVLFFRHSLNISLKERKTAFKRTYGYSFICSMCSKKK